MGSTTDMLDRYAELRDCLESVEALFDVCESAEVDALAEWLQVLNGYAELFDCFESAEARLDYMALTPEVDTLRVAISDQRHTILQVITNFTVRLRSVRWCWN